MNFNFLFLILNLIYYVTAYTEDVKILCPKGYNGPIKDGCFATVRFNKKMQKDIGKNNTIYEVREYINIEVNYKYVEPKNKIEISNDEIYDKDLLKILCVDGFDKYRKDCSAMRLNKSTMPKTLGTYVNYSMTDVLSGSFDKTDEQIDEQVIVDKSNNKNIIDEVIEIINPDKNIINKKNFNRNRINPT